MARGLTPGLSCLSKIDGSHGANIALTLESIQRSVLTINQILHTSTLGFRHERLDAGHIHSKHISMVRVTFQIFYIFFCQ